MAAIGGPDLGLVVAVAVVIAIALTWSRLRLNELDERHRRLGARQAHLDHALALIGNEQRVVDAQVRDLVRRVERLEAAVATLAAPATASPFRSPAAVPAEAGLLEVRHVVAAALAASGRVPAAPSDVVPAPSMGRGRTPSTGTVPSASVAPVSPTPAASMSAERPGSGLAGRLLDRLRVAPSGPADCPGCDRAWLGLDARSRAPRPQVGD